MEQQGIQTPDRPLVLLVDDDPDLRILAEFQLSDSFDVLQASDGPECLRLAAEKIPDVILLDMMMPGMDGSQVLTELAEDPTTKDIPVIFLSALSGTEARVTGIERGAVDYISKPADPREFVARVGAAARTRARHLEARREASDDRITGLPDRRAFETRLLQEIARAKRLSAPLTVLLMDIDQMDSVNESYGKVFGDELLRGVAGVLTSTLRLSDVVFRYGGDEFAAVLPDSDVGSGYLASERCRNAIAKLHPEVRGLTVSAGVAELPPGRTAEELVAKAEIALFRAKESGGNRSWRADDPRRHSLNPISLAEELTEREWSIVVHLADRRTEHDIATRMGIRPGTVRSHKARIRRKLSIAPDIRLSDFVRENFRDLAARIGTIEPNLGSAKKRVGS